jgi:hypothetical protein
MDVTDIQIDQPPTRLACHSELKGWLLDWLGRVDGEMGARAMMLIYNHWLARNDARDSQRIEHPRLIVQRIIIGLDEWYSANNRSVSKPARAGEHWLPPVQDWHKINVDGAFRLSEKRGGGGVVIRDCNGSFISGA